MAEIVYRPEVPVANLALKVPYLVVVMAAAVQSIPKFLHLDTDLINLHWLNGGHYLEAIISLRIIITAAAEESSLVITE